MEFKSVTSKNVYSEIIPFGTLNPAFNGYNQINGSSLKMTVAQRDPNNGRAFSNLYSSFSLPAANFQVTGWDIDWTNNAIQNIDDANEVVVVEIPKNTYGELIDGRTIKLDLPIVSATTTLTCYSSYYQTYNASSDPSPEAEVFGHTSALSQGLTPDIETPSTNVSFLFSDQIDLPVNGGSWADGYTTSSPPKGYPDGTTEFSFDNTKKVAAATDTGSGLDKPIGICYLDKGFIVITHNVVKDMIAWSGATTLTGGTFGTSLVSGATQVYWSTGSDLTFYSFEKQWVLDVLCQADPGEFYITSNPTAADLNPTVTPGGNYDLQSVSKPVYITEIGLYDSLGHMVAIAKPDKPIEKYYNNPSYFNLKFRF